MEQFRLKLPQIAKYIIPVASGKGGVGKSTLALNIAIALKKLNFKVGILDADIYGPSLPKLLGTNNKPEILNNKISPNFVYNLQTMSIGYLIPENSASIWRGPMVIKVITQFLRDVEWNNLDFLIVDLPPGTGDVQLTLAQKLDLSGVLIVTTPHELSLIDVKKGINMFQKVNVPIIGIIENMSYFYCSTCNKKHYIFGEKKGKKQASELDIEFLGEIPISNLINNPKKNIPLIEQDPTNKISKIFFEMSKKIISKVKK